MKASGKFVICDRGNERSRMQIFTKHGHFVRYVDRLRVVFPHKKMSLFPPFPLFFPPISLLFPSVPLPLLFSPFPSFSYLFASPLQKLHEISWGWK